MVFNFLKNKAEGANEWITSNMARYSSVEDAEAIVSVMGGISLIDGNFSDAERQKMYKSFSVHPVLKQHSPKDLQAKFIEIEDAFGIDESVGEAQVLKEVNDVLRKMGSSPDRERFLAIVRMGVAAARSDGDIGDKERALLSKVASLGGVQLSEVGL